MRKSGVVLTAFAGLLVALLVLSGADPAFGQGGKKAQKVDPAVLNKVLKKVDPEIRAAQDALKSTKKELERARTKLLKALADDVLNEKGPTQGKVIDRLKASVKHANNALAQVDAAVTAANIAQLLDKGGN